MSPGDTRLARRGFCAHIRRRRNGAGHRDGRGDSQDQASSSRETRSDLGRPVSPPTRKAAAVAVIHNPFAGRYVEDLDALMEIGAELGGMLGQMCVKALGIRPRSGGELRQGRHRRRERRMGARRGDPAPEARCAAAQGRGEGRSAGALGQEARRARAARSTSRSATRTQPMSAAISTAWRCACPTRRAPTRSWSRSR